MDEPQHRRLASTLQTIIITGMAVAAVGALATIGSPAGLGLVGSSADQPIIETDATVDFDVALGDRLTWRETDGVLVDAATGQGTAEIGEPVRVHVSLHDPSTPLRLVWVAARLLGPTAAFGGLWLSLRIVRSTRDGHPFTVENEQRLWHLATLVAIGGTVVAMAGDLARNLALQSTAAADMFGLEFTLNFLPIVAGIAVGVLAGVWRMGVGMSDELAATI